LATYHVDGDMLPRDGAGTTGTGRGPGLERRPGVEEPHRDVLRRAGLVGVDRADDVVGLGDDTDLRRVLRALSNIIAHWTPGLVESASLSRVIVPACVAWSPWLKFNRAMFMPLSRRTPNISVDQQAGPMVQMMRVCFVRAAACGGNHQTWSIDQ
jgi:hypothetical protein